MSQAYGFVHQATLAEVARAAGVSIPTVSKVVTGRADVSEATRARVKQLLREHDYVCRPYGRRRKRQAAISLVFDTLESPYAMEIARGGTNVDEVELRSLERADNPFPDASPADFSAGVLVG